MVREEERGRREAQDCLPPGICSWERNALKGPTNPPLNQKVVFRFIEMSANEWDSSHGMAKTIYFVDNFNVKIYFFDCHNLAVIFSQLGRWQ